MLKLVFIVLICCAQPVLLLTSACAADVQRPNGEKGRARPQPRPFRVQQLSPELEQVLVDWAKETGKIQRLSGSHTRYMYDLTWNLQEVATGVFYYGAPDMGRIDIHGANLKNVRQVRKSNKPPNKPFKLKASEPEKWICDGKKVMQIDDVEKKYEVHPIPAEKQGRNIMEVPLPFLLGMPPKKAKERYFLAFDDVNKPKAAPPAQVWLKIKPRWAADAANWQEATVILDSKRMYLPIAVKMIHPGKTKETAYIFGNFKVNDRVRAWQIWKEKNPFAPKLRGYKRSIVAARPQVPAVLGLSVREAKEKLGDAGYKVALNPGQPAPNRPLQYVVYAQHPDANTPAAKGKPIELTYYDENAAIAPAPRTARRGKR
jgi:TIGR03009 family protein